MEKLGAITRQKPLGTLNDSVPISLTPPVLQKLPPQSSHRTFGLGFNKTKDVLAPIPSEKNEEAVNSSSKSNLTFDDVVQTYHIENNDDVQAHDIGIHNDINQDEQMTTKSSDLEDFNACQESEEVQDEEMSNALPILKGNSNDDDIELLNKSARNNMVLSYVKRSSHIGSMYGNKLKIPQYELSIHNAISINNLPLVKQILHSMANDSNMPKSGIVLQSDSYGRNALHVACSVPSTGILEIVQYLFYTKVDEIKSVRKEYLKRLQEERKNCLLSLGRSKELTRDTSEGAFAGYSVEAQAIENWFEDQVSNAYRKTEFDIEKWWMKCISSKDMQGSTPLHSCCSSGCEPVLRFLILHATGNLSTSSKLSISSSLTRKKLLNSCEIVSTGTPTVLYSKNAVWFASDSLYDSNSGEELVQSTNATVQSSSHRTLLTPPLKIVSLSDPRLYIYKSTSSEKKDILSKTGSSLVEPAKYTVDYDVVIPWVMRNMLRKANAMGEKLGASAVDILKEIIETIDSHNSNTLLPHEVSEMLNYFGIMVTKDIVKEFCCLYPSSLDDIDEKWELMQDIHGINFVKQYRAHAKTESHDEDFEESKGWKGLRRDSKSSQRNSRIVSNPNDDEDDDDEAKAESKGNERSHMQTSKSIRRNDKILQSIDVSDENFGLDVNMMLDDLVSKRSFKTTTFRKTSDEDEEEMPIENEDDKTDMLESRSRKIPTMNEKALLPSAVTVSYIKRLRRQLVNPQDSNGYSPLMVAAALGNIAHIEFLIHHGGDVSLTAYDGNSALSVAKDASVSSLLQKQLLDWLRKCKSNMVRRGICETTGGADNSTGKWGSTSKGFSSEVLEKISDSQLLHFDKTNASTLIQDACAHDITLLHSQLKSLESNRYDFCRTSLSRAISAGLVTSVKHILDMGMTPNTADICGRRALHVCVEVASQVGMASTCELSRLDDYIQVLLSLRSLIEDLLHKGADVNAITVSGRTALHELFCKGSDIISISASTSVSRGSYERRILDKSLCHVKSLIVRTLVQWGADPTTLDRHGYCPIHYCARENMVDCMVEILKNSKIKSSLIYVTDMRGRTPLHIACQMNSPEVALVICKWDGDSSVGVLGVADKSGKVPLDLLHPNMNAIHLMTIWKACRNGLIDKLNEIIQHQDNDNEKDYDTAATATGGGRGSAVDREGSAQEPWMIRGVNGRTTRNKWSAVHTTILGWAEWTIENENNINAKRFLVYESSNAIVKSSGNRRMTLTKKSQMHRKLANNNVDLTKLRSSKASDHGTILSILAQNYAYMDALDIKQRTPLMYAAASNLPDAVKILVSSGCKINIKDNDGNTALHFAYAMGSIAAASALESCGADVTISNNGGRQAFDVVGISSAVSLLLLQ